MAEEVNKQSEQKEENGYKSGHNPGYNPIRAKYPEIRVHGTITNLGNGKVTEYWHTYYNRNINIWGTRVDGKLKICGVTELPEEIIPGIWVD